MARNLVDHEAAQQYAERTGDQIGRQHTGGSCQRGVAQFCQGGDGEGMDAVGGQRVEDEEDEEQQQGA